MPSTWSFSSFLCWWYYFVMSRGQEFSSSASPAINALWANIWPGYKYFQIISILCWCNWSYTIIYFSRHWFSAGAFPFRYLGVPLRPHRLLASQYSPLIHKLEAVIQGWLGKHLSYAVRLELIKSVLYGMVQFWVSIFPIPHAAIRQITYLCRNFLWTGNTCRSKSALVAWKTICLPKNEGWLVLKSAYLSRFYIIILHLKYQ